MSLIDLCRAAFDSFGLVRLRYIQEIRSYIKAKTETEICDEISYFGNVELLRILWAAGLSAPLQDCVMRRVRELLEI